jgi:hypothetical protein
VANVPFEVIVNSDMLTQFLIDVTRGARRDAYAADAAAVIAAAPLGEQQRDLVRTADIAGLYAAGVHPIVLLTFARSCGWSMERYYDCLDAAAAAGATAAPLS